MDISTNHLGAIEREVKTPTMETFVKLLNVLGAEPNEVLNEVIPASSLYLRIAFPIPFTRTPPPSSIH